MLDAITTYWPLLPPLIAGVVMLVMDGRETSRQRAYRDAIDRGDWDEVDRLMGVDDRLRRPAPGTGVAGGQKR